MRSKGLVHKLNRKIAPSDSNDDQICQIFTRCTLQLSRSYFLWEWFNSAENFMDIIEYRLEGFWVDWWVEWSSQGSMKNSPILCEIDVFLRINQKLPHRKGYEVVLAILFALWVERKAKEFLNRFSRAWGQGWYLDVGLVKLSFFLNLLAGLLNACFANDQHDTWIGSTKIEGNSFCVWNWYYTILKDPNSYFTEIIFLILFYLTKKINWFSLY